MPPILTPSCIRPIVMSPVLTPALAILLGVGARDAAIRRVFASGVTGYYADPSDLVTAYQDSAGTTAGAVDQPVGLRLDKSRGAAAEAALTMSDVLLVPGAGTAVDNGDGTYTASNGGAIRIRYPLASLVNGQSYLCRVNLLAVSGGNAAIDWCDSPSAVGPTFNTTGWKQIVASRAIYDSTYRFVDVFAATGATVTVRASEIDVRPLPGNHTTQSTSTSRPALKSINGYLWEELDGTDDFRTSATGGGGTTGFFYCAAVYVGGGAGTVRIFYSDAGANIGYGAGINGANQLQMWAGNGVAFTTAATSGTLPVGEAHIITEWDDGTNLNVQIDNGTVASTARPAVSAGTASFTEGRSNSGSTQYLPGRLGTRVMFKNYCPDASTREQIKRFIAIRNGIAL